MALGLEKLPLPPTVRLLGEALRTFDPRGLRPENAKEALALGYGTLRTGLFVAESIPLFLLSGPPGGDDANAKPPPEGALETTLGRLRELLERDAALIGRGDAPLSVLTPRDPLGHGARLLRILADGPRIGRRRRRRAARDFSSDARPWLDELPAYYRRNFHYQTDGYLSERSAELYEHQVELLFRGGADAMRRLILPPLTRHFGDSDGAGLHFLELGAGTGTATRSVARRFPAAKITCVELSPPYARVARRQLEGFPRVDVVQGDAAALDFGDARFDAVYSVFLFHELPLPVRELVLAESARVLKPGGFFGLVDSLQKGDDPALDWALDFFPRAFHEPYYAHYAAHPMERLVAAEGLAEVESGTGYLAKWLAARKPSAPATSTSTADQSAL